MPPTLLADLALLLSFSTENVATRALELLLARSVAARNALNRVVNEWRGRVGPRASRWASEVGGSDDARTDLEGYDETGGLVAILENKFWAGLTENQPSTYLRRLLTSDGILVFVAPASRVMMLTHELEMRMNALGETAATFANVGSSRVARDSSGRTIAVTSWTALLDNLDAAMQAEGESDNLADLRQLRALVVKMEIESFRPFSITDLTGDTPRLLLRLGTLVDLAVQQLLTRSFIDKKGLKASGGQGWYGHYIRIHGFGCQLIMTAHRWSAFGLSPVWLRITAGAWAFPEALQPPLRGALDDPSWLFEDRSRYWSGIWLPIRLLEGRERDSVVENMVRQVERIADALKDHRELGTNGPPPMDAAEVSI